MNLANRQFSASLVDRGGENGSMYRFLQTVSSSDFSCSETERKIVSRTGLQHNARSRYNFALLSAAKSLELTRFSIVPCLLSLVYCPTAQRSTVYSLTNHPFKLTPIPAKFKQKFVNCFAKRKTRLFSMR